jgi:capsule biosynthesis phosphatase
MRICIDIDGVLASFKKEGQTYADVAPIEGSVETLKMWKDQGHYLILNTARHMKTCDGNVGKVIAKIGKMTIDWLDVHGFVYDELLFGKPWAEVYIDDNAFRFLSWEDLKGNAEKVLPQYKEKLAAKL